MGKQRPGPGYGKDTRFYTRRIPGRKIIARLSCKCKHYEVWRKGDGKTDDTRALRKAIAACKKNGAVYLPAGTYLISDSIIIRKSDLCIRGAGSGETIIAFSRGLEELYPLYNISNPNQTSWSWSGALLLFSNTTRSGIAHITVSFPTALMPA